MATLDWTDRLHIKCPTLVVSGRRDCGSTSVYDAMRECIPDVEVISYEGMRTHLRHPARPLRHDVLAFRRRWLP